MRSVILDRDNYDLWLDPGMTNTIVETVCDLLKPYDIARVVYEQLLCGQLLQR